MRRLGLAVGLGATLLTLLGPSAGIALASAAAITATEGQSFSGVVDMFSCPAADRVRNVSIDWGDQTSSGGSVAGTGTCTISGTHTYGEEGPYVTHVTYTIVNSSNDAGTATVNDAQLNTSTNTLSAAAGSPLSGVVATFSDPAPEPLSSYSATIDWGDGHSSPGSISSGFAVSGSHTYPYGGAYTVTVTIHDEGGATAAPQEAATVSGCPTSAPSTPSPAFSPTASGLDARYVQALYHDLLGRSPAASDVAYATQALSLGATRDQLVLSLLGSSEYRQDLVNAAYSTFLGRPADPPSVSFFLGLLQGGASDEALDAQVLGSAEYFSNLGNNSNGFLAALYCETIFRPIDPSAEAFFESALGGGTSRTTVAANVLGSNESLSGRVNGYYLRFLRRAATTSSLSFYDNLIHSGGSDEQVIASLLSSPEYYALFNHTAATVTRLNLKGIIHTTISRPATLTLTVLRILPAARDAAAAPSVLPRTRRVGVVNFGHHRKGRVTLHWNRKVGTRRLARGNYVLLLQAHHGGKLIYVSDALPFKVG